MANRKSQIANQKSQIKNHESGSLLRGQAQIGFDVGIQRCTLQPGGSFRW